MAMLGKQWSDSFFEELGACGVWLRVRPGTNAKSQQDSGADCKSQIAKVKFGPFTFHNINATSYQCRVAAHFGAPSSLEPVCDESVYRTSTLWLDGWMVGWDE